MMSDTTVKIINCETGEEIIREMTTEELKQYEEDCSNSERTKMKAQSDANAKTALLKKLGIDESDLKTLLS